MFLKIAKFHYFLWSNSTPLCVCVYIHTYLVFLIQSYVDGYLGCLHILEITNNASVHIRVHVSFKISVFV